MSNRCGLPIDIYKEEQKMKCFIWQLTTCISFDPSFFLYKVRNVSFTRIKYKEKDNLPNEMIEKYTYSFSIFSHVADIDDRKMQSTYSFVYVCFACLMGVIILCHHSTINIIIDCIEKGREKKTVWPIIEWNENNIWFY